MAPELAFMDSWKYYKMAFWLTLLCDSEQFSKNTGKSKKDLVIQTAKITLPTVFSVNFWFQYKYHLLPVYTQAVAQLRPNNAIERLLTWLCLQDTSYLLLSSPYQVQTDVMSEGDYGQTNINIIFLDV